MAGRASTVAQRAAALWVAAVTGLAVLVAAGVRSATVAVPWRGGFVIAGRSLRSTEVRVHTGQVVVAGLWVATLRAAAGAALLAAASWPKD